MYLLSLFKPIQSMSCRYSRTDHAILQRGCLKEAARWTPSANLKLQIQGRLNPSNRYQNTDDFFSSYVYRVDKEVLKKTNKSKLFRIKKNNIRILVHAVVPKILIREFVLRKITLKQLITLILPRISKSVGRSVPIITSIYLKLKLAEKYGCCHLFLACLFDIFFL